MPRLDEKTPFCVVMCDLDWFKRVNDEHGHAIGDEVLVRVAQLLAAMLRGSDAVVRWGGEEFLLVLHQVDLEKAAKVAERALKVVGDEAFTARGLHITLSAGVAERCGAEATEQLLRRADEALYAAKRDGRNCVRRAT
jgi:diguanylate cyclase (GGDEF)-like protein